MNNLESMRKRLEWQGGIRQEDRMIKGKWWTLQRALQYSYQGCDVQMVQPFDSIIGSTAEGFQTVRALINPDKVKQDYDDKIISIDRDYNFDPGDVFEWKGTGTHWIIYLEEITEDAYFRGEIRRCKYKIKFKDSNNNECETWAAIRGPVETAINSIQKNQTRVDRPNMSLNILMPLNEYTKDAFERYSEFLFAGKCWRVNAIDFISMRNVLEVNAEEYYIDKDTDDVEQELKDGLVVEPIDPTPETVILGETFIKPQIAEVYTAPAEGGCWEILERDYPVKLKVLDDTRVQVIWLKMTSGQFTLQWYKDTYVEQKTIVVESLF